jgi:Arc/MetJ-type ribon-helix-helix transcriptional regulator
MSVIGVHLDEETERALDVLTRSGRSRPEVVRESILLANRQESAALLRAEAEVAAIDTADLFEVRAIRAEMDGAGR